ncbi:hypothetical protein ECANGB1_1854 [Enterospora canceri]|uniref:Uncharacterized protein n=1 Tax=Enterospora canceri TaxID=1081671 RepID=A0A1Y1S636_9MICR|nr:hypothetical protein ECANGB1_1854 [Enterospora canceri]
MFLVKTSENVDSFLNTWFVKESESKTELIACNSISTESSTKIATSCALYKNTRNNFEISCGDRTIPLNPVFMDQKQNESVLFDLLAENGKYKITWAEYAELEEDDRPMKQNRIRISVGRVTNEMNKQIGIIFRNIESNLIRHILPENKEALEFVAMQELSKYLS